MSHCFVPGRQGGTPNTHFVRELSDMRSDWPVTDFEWSGSLATDHDAHLLFMYWLLDGSTRSKVWVLYSVNTLKSELCSWWAGITWRMVTNIHIHQNMYMYIYTHGYMCSAHITVYTKWFEGKQHCNKSVPTDAMWRSKCARHLPPLCSIWFVLDA